MSSIHRRRREMPVARDSRTYSQLFFFPFSLLLFNGFIIRRTLLVVGSDRRFFIIFFFHAFRIFFHPRGYVCVCVHSTRFRSALLLIFFFSFTYDPHSTRIFTILTHTRIHYIAMRIKVMRDIREKGESIFSRLRHSSVIDGFIYTAQRSRDGPPKRIIIIEIIKRNKDITRTRIVISRGPCARLAFAVAPSPGTADVGCGTPINPAGGGCTRIPPSIHDVTRTPPRFIIVLLLRRSRRGDDVRVRYSANVRASGP